jgi:hypothetical protein
LIKKLFIFYLPHRVHMSLKQTTYAHLLDLELTKRICNYRILERELHYKHRDKRIRGEWFAFADDVDLEL